MAQDIPLVYLVDEGGLRSSIDHFTPIRKDSAHDVFNTYAQFMHISRPPTRNISINFMFVSCHTAGTICATHHIRIHLMKLFKRYKNPITHANWMVRK